MERFLFLLGREPRISKAEIESWLTREHIPFKIEADIDHSLIISTEIAISAEKLITALGGTIKIAKELIPARQESTEEHIVSHLLKVHFGKISFAISGTNADPLAKTVKKLLKEHGRNARYLHLTNTATILHNDLVKKQSDFTIIDSYVFVTQAIQPIEELSARDYGRPGSDAKSGMLPPKLARMMINLAELPHTAVLLDPFCGSGTILSEAIVLGYKNLIGSDQSQKAINNTKKNIT